LGWRGGRGTGEGRSWMKATISESDICVSSCIVCISCSAFIQGLPDQGLHVDGAWSLGTVDEELSSVWGVVGFFPEDSRAAQFKSHIVVESRLQLPPPTAIKGGSGSGWVELESGASSPMQLRYANPILQAQLQAARLVERDALQAFYGLSEHAMAPGTRICATCHLALFGGLTIE
jgi:hypothetical protein